MKKLTASPAAAAAPSGFDFLFAASQVETTKSKKADVEADGVKVPSRTSTSVVRNGIGSTVDEGEGESVIKASSSEYNTGNSTADDALLLKNQLETFPQVLHEILNTEEYQSIAHWLPDGFSFIITDKRRFSDEILPKYFRVALFHSFIRKLNRWGFRRVKSRCKGEESSFAHNHFVRDKPWLCLEMSCKSKPTYSKDPAKKAHPSSFNALHPHYFDQQEAAMAMGAANTSNIANAAHIAMPAWRQPSFSAAGGTIDASRVFIPTSYLPATCALSTATTSATGSPAGTYATTIQENPRMKNQPTLALETDRQFLLLEHTQQQRQRILLERQILMFQMSQRHQLQVQLQCLNEMSSQNEERYANSYVQNSMMAQMMRGTFATEEKGKWWGGSKLYVIIIIIIINV